MDEPQLQFLDVGSGDAARKIAYRQQSGRGPGVVWMQGLKSDMISTKATALQAWAVENEAPLLRFDCSGHGESGGRFEDGTIGRWLEESEAVFTQLTDGPQVVVGSSMGGYLALLLVRRLLAVAPQEAERISSLVLIAPAWDMTETLMWAQFGDEIRRTIMSEGQWMRPSSYGDPYPITRCLIEDGREHLLFDKAFDPGRPVLILQGCDDPDVPLAHVRQLSNVLRGDWIQLQEVAGGDHRLSRPEDIALLLRTVAAARRAVN